MRVIAFLLWLLVSFSLSAQQPKVIVIGFDGLSGWALSRVETPALDMLKQNGVFTLKAKAVRPTDSAPNWASMIMGASPKQHQITSNGWKEHILKRKIFCNRPKGKLFPTIFDVLREQRSHLDIYVVHHWKEFAKLTDEKVLDALIHEKTEQNTLAKAIELIKSKQPDLLFLHFDHCDHAGHAYGHDSPQYFEAVKAADSIVAEIIKATQTAGIFKDTYFLVTSDHGGIKKGHGGNHPREIEIPWILSGPKTAKNVALPDHSVQQYDTAPTIAHIFGIKTPPCWIGQPPAQAFISSSSE
ncbi:MAG: alkaline phosphatase [Chitinophagales bacterium]|nr:alkaline phosphatase [Chitinophagales bacterium]MDW8272705.1 alkaline phosphatase [Chitinophagales bacterium]